MQQEAFIKAPAATASLSAWESYLTQCLLHQSHCRVRSCRSDDTPQTREQQFLQRLAGTARSSFHQTALAGVVPVLQREILERIQLRRRLVSDDSAAWNRAEVFLAVGELHRSIKSLFDEMDVYQRYHQQLKPQVDLWQEITQNFIVGSLAELEPIQMLIRQVKHQAADASIQPDRWLEVCCLMAEYESRGTTSAQRSALAVSLQTAYLAARIFRQSSWLLDTDAVLAAALFKDIAWLMPGASDKMLAQGEHAIWGAGLVSQAPLLGSSVPRLIRQHHECLDGSGLPLAVSSTQLRRDDRLLGLLTRWSELFLRSFEFASPLQKRDADFLLVPGEILIPECLDGRWDSGWLTCLYENLGLPHPDTLPVTKQHAQQNANPHWHIPRPHFAKAQAATPQAAEQRQAMKKQM